MEDLEKNRRKLYSIYREKIYPNQDIPKLTVNGEEITIDDFLQYFESGDKTEKLFKFLSKHTELKSGGNYLTYGDFLKKYACDKSWAKDGNLCAVDSSQQQGSTTQSTIPTTPSTFQWDTNCTTYKKGCKSDIIKKVQTCLGVKATGQWWDKTQKAIEEKFPQFVNGFTNNDISTICGENNQTTTEPQSQNNTQPTSQETKKPFRYSDVEWVPFKESILSNKILKEQQSSLSTTDFWNKVIEGGCFPENHKKMGVFQDKNEPDRLTYMTKDLDTNEIFYWFRNGVKINKYTNEKSTWTCKALEEYKAPDTQFNELLTQFGITEKNPNPNQIKKITNYLQSYAAKDAVSDIFNKWNNFLKSKNYKDDTGFQMKINTDEKNDISNFEPNELKTNYYTPSFDEYGWSNVVIYFPKGKTKGLEPVKKTELDKKECQDYLKYYLVAAIEYRPGQEVIPQYQEYKSQLKKCSRAGMLSDVTLTKQDLPDLDKKLQVIGGFLSKWFKSLRELDFKEIKNILKGNSKVIQAPNPYIINLDVTTESLIRNVIKTTLTEVREEKQKNLIEENIVRTRTFVLLENVKLTNKKREIKFVDELIKESFFLQSQNFDQQIIKEEFWDVLTGFFGRDGSESVFKTFKDRMGDWLVSHLSPNKKEGWIPKAIKKSINKIELKDVEKITDCKFLTKKLSDSIIESLNEKMMKSETNENGLYDVVKSGMSYDVNNPRFKEELKYKISKMMCPLIDRVSNDLDRAFEKMKQNAING